MSGRLEELKEAAAEQSGHGKSPVVIDGSRLLALIELVEAQRKAMLLNDARSMCPGCGDCEAITEAEALYDKFNGGNGE